MISIKTKLKINKTKERISTLCCKLFKPLVKIMDKIDSYKYNKLQKKANNAKDDKIIKMYAKYIINYLSKLPNEEFYFDIASYCYGDYGENIINAMQENKNKVIKYWSNNFHTVMPFEYDIKNIENLTNMLKIELEKHSEISCEYIIYDNIYSWKMKNYKKTLIVKLK